MEIFEEVKSKGGEYSLFALTDTGYEKLALNFTDIRNRLSTTKTNLIIIQRILRT